MALTREAGKANVPNVLLALVLLLFVEQPFDVAAATSDKYDVR